MAYNVHKIDCFDSPSIGVASSNISFGSIHIVLIVVAIVLFKSIAPKRKSNSISWFHDHIYSSIISLLLFIYHNDIDLFLSPMSFVPQRQVQTEGRLNLATSLSYFTHHFKQVTAFYT